MSQESNDLGSLKVPLLIEDIQKILPHRYPFLMVDRVTEFVDKEYIAGYKNVAANEPYFAGHFPNRPVMPGVLMLEALAQIGAIFAHSSTGGADSRKSLIVFSGADNVRFRKIVIPGDVLRLEMRYHSHRSSYWKMQGTVTVEGDVVCEALISAAEIREK